MKEVYIDTNVFLRYFLNDVEDQFSKAKELIEEIESGKKVGKISILVINELIWILEKYYSIERTVYIPRILKLLLIDQMKIVEVKKEELRKILEKFQKKKYDFTDIYLSSITSPENIASFDRYFEKIN